MRMCSRTGYIGLDHSLNDRPIDVSEYTCDDIGDQHTHHRRADQPSHAGLVVCSEDEVRTTAYCHCDDDAPEYESQT